MASARSTGASEKHRPTLADWIVTAISPALIVGLVGSLVFFLAEVLYAGKYEVRLLWTLFFFVFGIVLVARISIEVDTGRAAAYGLGLATVSWIALTAYVEFPRESRMAEFAPLINLLLMAVIWWSAHKLTWDCTFIDEKRHASGRGILAAAGLEHHGDTQGQVGVPDLSRLEQAPEPDPKRSLLERWTRFRKWRRTRPHTPGTSVVWFSLAALPIFGLGQSLVPASDAARRSFTFWLAAIYVACGLGLLLTTSFLGLRRYLRQRKLRMPPTMTGAWLGLGAALVLGFVFIAALLPRPYSETPIWALKRIGSPDRQASKNAQMGDGASKGEGNPGHQTDPQSKQKVDKGGKGPEGGEEESGNKKDGTGREESKDQHANSGNDSDDRNTNSRDGGNSDRRFPDTRLGNALEKFTTFLKWLVFILLALVVLAFVFRGLLRHLGQFMPWARHLLESLQRWWASLWGRTDDIVTDLQVVAAKPVRSFATFSNPFADGTAEGRSTEELIEYSFSGLEAWAADRNHPRRLDETALEFTSRLSNTFPILKGEAQLLAVLVVRLAYANGVLPAESRATLAPFWNQLTAAMPPAEPIETA